MEHIKRFLLFFGMILLVSIPAMVPEVTIAICLVMWPIVYAIIALMGIGSDSTNTIPWFTISENYSVIALLLPLVAIGLLNGIRGAAAMFVFYLPFLWIGPFMLWVGLAAEGETWGKYVRENYQDTACEMGLDGFYMTAGNTASYCMHYPRAGRMLPAFATDYASGSDDILEVIPYQNIGQSRSAQTTAKPVADPAAAAAAKAVQDAIAANLKRVESEIKIENRKRAEIKDQEKLAREAASMNCKTNFAVSADGTTITETTVCK